MQETDRTDASYASVHTVPVAAMQSAASELSREWGENRRIGSTQHTFVIDGEHEKLVFFVFLCGASDGSRWWLASTVYGVTAYTNDKSGHTLAALEIRCQEAAAENDRKLSALD